MGGKTIVIDATTVFAVSRWYDTTENWIAALLVLKSRGADLCALASKVNTLSVKLPCTHNSLP